MSINTLAELVGLSRCAVLDYESGRTEPTLESLKEIAVALNIEADKLYDCYYAFLDYPFTTKTKEIRAKHRFLQRELGEMLGVGRRSVERWEGGKNTPSRDRWEQLKALNLT